MHQNNDWLTIPDLMWYGNISRARQLTPRCPFATVEVCPRYYQSLSLLGTAGSTKIPAREDKRLLEKWEKSDLWPRTDEYATVVSGPSGSPRHFTNFCPEVSFDRFGYFASGLFKYADEIDADFGHKQLAKFGSPKGHWGWNWQSVSCQHYTDCPIFSILEQRTKNGNTIDGKNEQPWYKRPIGQIIIGIIVAISAGLLLKWIG